MITIKLFGLLKTLAHNQTDLSFALNGGRRVKDLVALLDAKHPQIGELIHKKKVLVSVNQEIAHEDTEVKDGDEVALLPPFAGGADDPMLVRVQRENFSVDAEIDRVRKRSSRIGVKPATETTPEIRSSSAAACNAAIAPVA